MVGGCGERAVFQPYPGGGGGGGSTKEIYLSKRHLSEISTKPVADLGGGRLLLPCVFDSYRVTVTPDCRQQELYLS